METKIPACVGITMDGNRRWAKARNLPTLAGHTEGLRKTKEIISHAFSRGVTTVVLYAFSTENWNRTAEEVEYLMRLFSEGIEREFEELSREGIQVRFIGDRARISPALRSAMENLEEKSAHTAKGKTLVIALSYGGRAEIVAAANRLLADGVQEVSEEGFAKQLWSHPMPDPDLVIRTGGERRLSNFLPWQSVYSELFFIDTFWPDFSCEEFDAILAEFAARERRHGK